MIPILFSLVKYMSSRQGEKGRRKVVGKRWGRGHSLVLGPCSGYEDGGDSETEGG